MSYDVINRLTNVVQLTNDAVSARAWYAYDAAGRLWKKGYGNNDVVTHSYDVESRLLSLGITNNNSLVTAYSYVWDDGGNILAITNFPGGVSVLASHYSYDSAGQLTNEVTDIETNSWVYDEAGNWLSGDGTFRHYDADNELLWAATNGASTVTVTGEVEPGSQSNKWYQTTAECRGVTVPVNQTDGTFSLPDMPLTPGQNSFEVTVTDVSGNQSQQTRHVTKNCLETFAYDNNGNLTNWVNGNQNWAYEWDWADRLTKVTSNNVVVLQNWYDANGRRIAKQEAGGKWLYLYDGWNILGVMNEHGQILETFTRGVGLAGDIGTLVAVTHHAGSVTNGTFYAHCNHRGDIILTRSGTTTVGSYSYSAFGLQTSALGSDVCRFKFSSKERDASTGFSYYGYRFYVPQWQRWPNGDPIGERGGKNLYGFARNNPLRYIDIKGLEAGYTYNPDGSMSIDINTPTETPWGCAERIANEVGRLRGTNPRDPSNRYLHCLASCQISQQCPGGRFTAWIAGDWVQDPWYREQQGDFADPGDRKANKVGRDASKCKSKSCEQSCQNALDSGKLY